MGRFNHRASQTGGHSSSLRRWPLRDQAIKTGKVDARVPSTFSVIGSMRFRGEDCHPVEWASRRRRPRGAQPACKPARTSNCALRANRASRALNCDSTSSTLGSDFPTRGRGTAQFLRREIKLFCFQPPVQQIATKHQPCDCAVAWPSAVSWLSAETAPGVAHLGERLGAINRLLLRSDSGCLLDSILSKADVVADGDQPNRQPNKQGRKQRHDHLPNSRVQAHGD